MSALSTGYSTPLTVMALSPATGLRRPNAVNPVADRSTQARTKPKEAEIRTGIACTGFAAVASREAVLIRDPYPNRKFSGWFASFLPHQSSAEVGCHKARAKRTTASISRVGLNIGPPFHYRNVAELRLLSNRLRL